MISKEKKKISKKRLKKFFILTFLSFFFTFGICEVVFQTYHFYYKIKKMLSSVKAKQSLLEKYQYKIMCIGNSHTAGLGAPPGESYPDHLQKIFNKNYGDRIVKIVNKGQSSMTTVQVIDQLDQMLEAEKPDMVLLQLGGANFNDVSGYHKKYGKRSFFWNYLYKLRSVKFLTDLYSFNNRIQLTMRSTPFPPKNHEEEKYLSNAKFKKSVDFTLKNFIFKESMYVSSNYFQELQRNHQSQIDEAISTFQEGILLFPDHFHNYLYLADIYLKIKRPQNAINILLKGFEINSEARIQGEINPLHNWIFHHNPYFNRQQLNVLKKYRKDFQKELDQLIMSENIDGTKIHHWVVDDLNIIIERLIKRKIKVIVQNYVPDSSNNFQPLPGDLELKVISNKYNLPFIDQNKYFLDLFKRVKDPGQFYFGLINVLDTHPNSKGYKVMAEHVFQYLKQHNLINVKNTLKVKLGEPSHKIIANGQVSTLIY